jgi:preprotein translocase subunit SecF
MVGPKVGGDLRRKAMFAVVASTIMMGIYLAFRFQPRFGVAAAVALTHDVAITIGGLLLFNYEFDLSVVAALLTVIGFSVNDTVIVFDRIRENQRRMRRQSLEAIANSSINETLSRTIITNGTAIFTVVALFLFGGSVIHTFAFALLVGFVVGTYSSIFVATPVVLMFREPAR